MPQSVFDLQKLSAEMCFNQTNSRTRLTRYRNTDDDLVNTKSMFLSVIVSPRLFSVQIFVSMQMQIVIARRT